MRKRNVLEGVIVGLAMLGVHLTLLALHGAWLPFFFLVGMVGVIAALYDAWKVTR